LRLRSFCGFVRNFTNFDVFGNVARLKNNHGRARQSLPEAAPRVLVQCMKAVAGVASTVPGCFRGSAPNPHCKMRCRGCSGHAEAVRLTFDRAEVYHQRCFVLHSCRSYCPYGFAPKFDKFRNTPARLRKSTT
jgi:hypothetical protein